MIEGLLVSWGTFEEVAVMVMLVELSRLILGLTSPTVNVGCDTVFDASLSELLYI